jgi:hypothetical protein
MKFIEIFETFEFLEIFNKFHEFRHFSLNFHKTHDFIAKLGKLLLHVTTSNHVIMTPPDGGLDNRGLTVLG